MSSILNNFELMSVVFVCEKANLFISFYFSSM